MSSCRKPEIHNDMSKITKIKLKCGQNTLTIFILSCFENYSFDF